MPESNEYGRGEQTLAITGDKDLRHLTPYQRVLLADLASGGVISWTFCPRNVRKIVWDLIKIKDVCNIVTRQVGNDPREYAFVELNGKGKSFVKTLI